MTLDALADDSRVFIDANIFIYYFTATSVACRRLLDRCAAVAIPRMGIEVEEVTHRDFISSLAVRRVTGLLTLDALVVAVMWRLQLAHLASADHGFRTVAGLSLAEPDDVRPAP